MREHARIRAAARLHQSVRLACCAHGKSIACVAEGATNAMTRLAEELKAEVLSTSVHKKD
eukprot:75378-Pleurochrysis_carterae.AAC.2